MSEHTTIVVQPDAEFESPADSVKLNADGRRAGDVQPADGNFTLDNGASDQEPRVLVIGCGALAREMVALRERNGLRQLDITCLPAIWHNHPERIPDGVRRKVRAAKETGRYAEILVAYGDCGTGGLLDEVLEEEGVRRLDGPHCYAFFSGNEVFAQQADDDLTCFYLTDYLARHFETLIWKGLGMAKHPELRDMYFGHYERVVYLAQTNDPMLDQCAEAAAVRLGLAYERRATGYGELATFLTATDPESAAAS